MKIGKTHIIIGLFVFSLLIRLIVLSIFPPGFYTDESAVGYSAYSVLKTGQDEFGNFLPLAFKSFNDYKSPLYIYLVVPFIFLFGLNEFAVRLPSVLLSSLTIILVYLLAKKIHTGQKYFAFLTAFLVSICPWHFTFSRIAFEGNTSLFFITLGIYLFLKIPQKTVFLSLSFIAFSLSIYSYHSARLIVPLLMIVLSLIYRKEFKLSITKLIISFLVFSIFSLPLLLQTIKHFDQVVRRPANVSIFKDKGIEGKLWEASVFDAGQNVLKTRFLHNKPYYYLITFLRNYFTHFDGRYLFLYGDLGEHFRIPNSGELYLVSFPFLISGFLFFLKNKIKGKSIIFLWLILAPSAAALTFMVPSGHRNLNSLIPLCFFIAAGILDFCKNRNNQVFVFVLFFLNIVYFDYQYFYKAKIDMAKDWNYGYKEMMVFIDKISSQYDKVIITDSSGESYMHFLFFSRYPPSSVQPVLRFEEIDKFGIGHVNEIGKYQFRNFDINIEEEKYNSRVLWAGSPENIPVNDPKLEYLKKIYYPDGKLAFMIVKKI